MFFFFGTGQCASVAASGEGGGEASQEQTVPRCVHHQL